MVDDEYHSQEEKIIETATNLAVNGKYNEAIELLYPLINSPYAIVVLNLLGKIYAQNMEFDSAEICFKKVLELDENNVEASEALNKCIEMKNSKIKRIFGYGLSPYLIILILLLIIIVVDAIFLIRLFMNFIH